MSNNVIRNRIYKYCKLANIPCFKFHSLRKSFATNLIEHGVPAVIVSKILGHSSVDVTSKFYVALTNTEQQTINSIIQDLVKE